MPRKAAHKPAEPSKPEPINQIGSMLTIDEAARLLDIGRAKMSELINSGKIKTVVIGPRIRRVRMSALQAYIDSL